MYPKDWYEKCEHCGKYEIEYVYEFWDTTELCKNCIKLKEYSNTVSIPVAEYYAMAAAKEEDPKWKALWLLRVEFEIKKQLSNSTI